MKQSVPCPDKDQLIDYLQGRIAEERLPELESHFESCVSCEETFQDLNAHDTFSGLIEQAMDNSAGPDPTELEFVEGLIQQIQGVSQSFRKKLYADERAAEVIRQLPASEKIEHLGKLGVYEVESLLGLGSTGVVFRAFDTQLQRPVALKVLRPSLGGTAKERFLAEARTVASIDHPHVVTIYQVGEENELAFIAMKWIAGETLEERFSRVAFLQEDEIVELARQIGQGLEAAHSRNLIHRDIKPANVWLSSDTNAATLLDFGLARIADDDPRLSTTGMLAGTPHFMSPEQSKGLELDGRSDLFGLGCLLYRTSTGKLPFGGGGVLATLQSIQNETQTCPVELNPHLSEDFSDLVMCLLEKQPANRPDNVNDFVKALGQPKTAWSFAPPSPARQTVRKLERPAGVSKRTPWTLWTAITILSFFVVMGMFFLGPDVVRIATNQGELIIQTNDKAIKIEVLSNGKVVRIIDTQTEQSINIRSGVYQFQVSDSRNGFRVSPHELEMTRGGKKVLSVLTVQNKNSAKIENETRSGETRPGGKQPEISTGTDTYDGQTFDQWAKLLKTEKNRKTIRTGLLAMGELSAGNAKIQKQAIEVVRPIVRQYGHSVLTGEPTELVQDINQFFGFMSSDAIIQFVREECNSGTIHSRRQMAWLVLPESVFAQRANMIVLHRKNVQKQFREIADSSLKLMNEKDPATRETGEALLTALVRCVTGHNIFLGGTVDPSISLDQKFAMPLNSLLPQAKNSDARTFIASLLIQYQRADELVVRQVAKALSDKNMSGKTGFIFYSYTRGNVPQKFAHLLVGPMLNLYNDEAKCMRICKYVTDKTFGVVTIEAIRHDLVKQLGAYGYASASALPFLDKFQEQDKFYAAAAKSRKQIRAELKAKSVTESSTESDTEDPDRLP